MKSILDPFEYTSSLHTDLRKTFDRVWREVPAHDDEKDGPVSDGESIWLECNGALVDSSIAKILRIRRAGMGAEIVEFICPYCEQPHESLHFR